VFAKNAFKNTLSKLFANEEDQNNNTSQWRRPGVQRRDAKDALSTKLCSSRLA